MASKRYSYFQPNKKDLKDEYGDCVIRAFCKAEEKEWLEIFDELIPYAREVQAHPNNHNAYEKWLAEKGYTWHGLKAVKGKKRDTPISFCESHKQGTYILRCSHHLVTVKDGKYHDVWDSGNCCVYGYWTKERV